MTGARCAAVGGAARLAPLQLLRDGLCDNLDRLGWSPQRVAARLLKQKWRRTRAPLRNRAVPTCSAQHACTRLVCTNVGQHHSLVRRLVDAILLRHVVSREHLRASRRADISTHVLRRVDKPRGTHARGSRRTLTSPRERSQVSKPLLCDCASALWRTVMASFSVWRSSSATRSLSRNLPGAGTGAQAV